MRLHVFLLTLGFTLLMGCGSRPNKVGYEFVIPNMDAKYEAQKIETSFQIDGVADEPFWNDAPWYTIGGRWLGEPYSPEDFSGQFKLAWSDSVLLLLVEIQDDVLHDTHEDPLSFYWEDDCVEIFLDADRSGGDHQYNHQAFAYHVALDGNVADMGIDKKAILLNHHLRSARKTDGRTSIWEFAINIYDDSYQEKGAENTPMLLSEGHVMGFALAYCDSDTTNTRENFIGSEKLEGEDKNRGWIDAGIFGALKLVK